MWLAWLPLPCLLQRPDRLLQRGLDLRGESVVEPLSERLGRGRARPLKLLLTAEPQTLPAPGHRGLGGGGSAAGAEEVFRVLIPELHKVQSPGFLGDCDIMIKCYFRYLLS